MHDVSYRTRKNRPSDEQVSGEKNRVLAKMERGSMKCIVKDDTDYGQDKSYDNSPDTVFFQIS